MDILNKLAQENRLCTGCEACRNICPHNAIEMIADQEGFLYPVIDQETCVNCGLCEKTCPVLHTVYKNSDTPASYAMMASDEERAESSSGALVPMVAKWIFRHNGVVFGAAWTKNWGVHQIAVEREEDLVLIRGSKYVQGRAEYSYQEAKKYIASGRWVLYTGLPCQIAGLYAFLGNEHPGNLITIEVLCHGAPSHKVFIHYLEENFDVSNMKEFKLRDKKEFGWSVSSTAYMKNGNILRTSVDHNSFFSAFNPVMIQRPSCAQCPMSRLPRQGDITAADFWGVERYRREFNDGKGTSAVLVNSTQGEKILQEIKSEFKLWEPVPLEYVTHINKTVLRPFSQHSGRKHFFSILDMKPFNESVERGLNHKYDIGVVGLWYGINYGSIITYYALYCLLREYGYDAVMLPKPNHLWEERFNEPESIAQRFIWRHCNVFLPLADQDNYSKFNELCDDFVLGSDVIWKYEICGRFVDQFFFLDWVRHGHKKIAYSSSLGSGLKGPDSYVKKAIRNLKRFDFISCRESSGMEELTKKTERQDIVHVLDPVFLCDLNVYRTVISESSLQKEKKFVFAYCLDPEVMLGASETVNSILINCHAEFKFCANPNEIRRFKRNYSNVLTNVDMEDWLWYMENCEFYIGDSYHGLCFALIFHKPFIIAVKDRSERTSMQRFESLLEIVGLQNRLLHDLQTEEDKVDELLNIPIDWAEVDRRLDVLKKSSMKWLQSALKAKPRETTAEDYLEEEYQDEKNRLKQQINEQQRNLIELNKSVESMKIKLAILTRKLGNIDYWKISNYDYAAEIAREHAHGRKIALYGDHIEMRRSLALVGLSVDCVVTGVQEKIHGDVMSIYDLKGRNKEFYIVVPFLEHIIEHIQRLNNLEYNEIKDYIFVRNY